MFDFDLVLLVTVSLNIISISGQLTILNPGDCRCTPINRCADGAVPIDPRIVNNNNPCPTGERICCRIIPSPPVTVCGTNEIIDVPQFPISGSQAPFGKYPWNAIIFETGNFNPIAGGALIDQRHVITTVHNILSKRMPLIVRLGEWNLNTTLEPFPHVSFHVTNIRSHEDYNSLNLRNDIAILTLESAVTYMRHIRHICLPPADFDFTGRDCWLSGYGKTSELGNTATTLKEVPLPVLNSDTCETRLKASPLGQYFQLDRKSFICAGGTRGQDACQGDGGYPLVCKIGDYYHLAGIVSWGIGCGRGIPGVYTNIASYIPWINARRNSNK